MTEDAEVVAAMAILFVRAAHRRGNAHNAPLGIFAAEFAGTPLGGIAFEAATLARAILDAE